MLALLRQRRVVDHEHRIRATDQSIRLHEKLALERRFVPNAGADKMMELIVIGGRHPQGHWLHALALAGTDQTRDIERTHPSARLVAQMPRNGPSQLRRSSCQCSAAPIASSPRWTKLQAESVTIALIYKSSASLQRGVRYRQQSAAEPGSVWL